MVTLFYPKVPDEMGLIFPVKAQIDTQSHVLEECAAFDNIRTEFNLKTEAGLVGFFKEVVKRRCEDENEDPSP